ncbi:MAG: hypothetical protein LBN29_02580 [Mediterranea sp.]|nr:hypothetical protein [Mediterranea sp.]
MNKIMSYCALAIGITLTHSCVKDMQDDLHKGGWNHERSITGISFANQVGQPVIQRIDESTGTIDITLNVGAIPDLSKVELTNLQLSYQATAGVKPGDMLDFSNDARTASIIVTSTLGETRAYTITAAEFREQMEGTWAINDLVVWGGTGPSYGGGKVYPMMLKSWCWDYANPPSKEYDNTLTFTLDKITDDGNTEGVCVNNAGADGAYANFIFRGASNPVNKTDIDLNHFYRKIPVGESRWRRNYADGSITFTDSNGNTSTATLVDAGEHVLYNNAGYVNAISVPNNAFAFTLNGTDDWSNIYSDYDVFAAKVRMYFVLVTKL